MANTNETVTVRLIVAADGALRTLDNFDTKMTEAANASVKSGAAVDAFTMHLERMRKAQEAGIPVLKARTAVLSTEERMLNSVMGRADQMARARINAERDVARAVASTSNLVVQGKMSEEDAIRAVTAVEQAHVATLNKMIAAQRAAADSAQMNATAVRGSASAVQAYNQSASRNAAESANIAMQFQDIAVSAQMGMSPMMVALQQGTQLSAIFNQMRNPLQALPAAFMSIVNPVSLLTIGLVALTTAAVQWGIQAISSNEDAASALEEHDKWLDQILTGYESIREAAKQAGQEAQRLPRAEVQMELDARVAEQQSDYASALAKVQTRLLAANIGQETYTSLLLEGGEAAIRQRDALLSIQDAALQTNPDLNGVIESLKRFIADSPTESLRGVAQQMLDNAVAARTYGAVLRETTSASRNLEAEGLGAKSFEEIRAGLTDLVSEHRRLQAEAKASAAALQASYQAAILAAQGYGQAAGAANVYAGSLSRLQALIPTVAAAQQAQNQLATAQIEFDKGRQALLEQQANGLARDVFAERMAELTSTYEQARDAVTGLTSVQEEQDRLTRQNGIDALTGKAAALARVNEQYRQQEEAIRALAQTGASQVEVERLLAQNAANRETALANAGMSFDAKGGKGGGGGSSKGAWDESFQKRLADLNQEIALFGQSTYEIERQTMAMDLLNQAKQANVAVTPTLIQQIDAMASSYAAATVELERMQEIQQFGQQVTSTLADGFKDLFKGLITGTKSANDAIADLLGKLGDLFLDRAFNMLFSGFGMGGGMGMGRGGLLGGMIIPGILHQGGVAGADGYGHGKAYSASLWANAPRYHNGGTIGLKPDEVPAILQRGETVLPRGGSSASGSGGQSVVVIRLEDGLTASIVKQAAGQAVQVTRGMVEPVSKAVNQMAQQQRYG